MKRSALLAVSALSLGVVGLASFAPVVSAVDAAVNLTVGTGGGMVTKPDGTATDNMNVTLTKGGKDVPANAVSDPATATVSAYNNAGGYTLTLSDSGDNADLTASDNGKTYTIPTGTNIAAGTAAWGVKLPNIPNGSTAAEYSPADDAAWQAMPVKPTADNHVTALTVANRGAAGSHTYHITFGASTATNTHDGAYTNEVTYTYTGK